MPKLFIAGIALFLLLGAGYGILQAARATPWDCSDWQAFAHDDRATAILESLAENRGKTLYCGIDQSDTFTKAETWEAGKDRNERDDTVYWGERGSFRGFIAAQEGWLTEGESGITGQSIATIFEFPRETERIKRTKRIRVGSNNDRFPINAAASCGEVFGIICSGEAASSWTNPESISTARDNARYRATGLNEGSPGNHIAWDTGRRTLPGGGTPNSNQQAKVNPKTPWWQGQAETFAERACRARGARLVAGSAAFGRGHNDNAGSGPTHIGDSLGFFLRQEGGGPGGTIRIHGRQSRTFTALCKKTVRRSR